MCKCIHTDDSDLYGDEYLEDEDFDLTEDEEIPDDLSYEEQYGEH